jgi:transcriptional regulator with GAF, ATPase, and Fis domain
MLELQAQIEAVASTRSTVLVTGETGTGKGLVARVIHGLSREPALPFVHVDCASLSPTVIESELFGHERGSFTGAQERRRGRFELAGRGTLLLDEIAEVEPRQQAKLLRVLEDRTFERVGGSETLPARARVVAATNRDLVSEIAAGRFRADLYYRLQVFELRVPPLRERLSDVPLLVRAAIGIRKGEAQALTIDETFYDRLVEYPWPGNVRELMNLVERLQVAQPAGCWDAAMLDGLLLPIHGVGPTSNEFNELNYPNHSAVLAGALKPRGNESRASFEAAERRQISLALGRHRWNVSAAARSLGVSRGALRGRMLRLGLR